ncbi:MAG: chondroitinase family polysaccharide lyase [Paludibacter sp.]|nr:chondroitinase family polysaccharide lyase [Paludibacter sp.]MDD4198451.1 chondroitinase family polysaccharide lyase [Paludibacter sp.]MDD4427721.1 chondroitinase family polysaccharide lyase [Paludibacter sp.]
MKTTYIKYISFFLLFAFHLNAGTIYSFEDGMVPSVFKAKRGALSVSSQRAKLGSRSLRWNWIANDTLVAAPLSMNTASIQANGGITTWIYNENPSSQKLVLWFYEYESSITRRCSLEVSLNFKGWRCVWARFRADMGHPGYTLRSMKWESPKSGSGTLYVDYLEFVDNVSWERISDLQYKVNNTSAELVDFVAVRNYPPQAPANTVTQEQRDAVQTLKKRIDDWHLGSGQFDDNPVFISRRNSFNSYVQTALNRISDLSLETLPDGTVNGEGLYPMDFYNTAVDGVNVKTFRDINEKYMIQLAYDAIKNNKTTSRELILKIFDWYYDQGWADGSALGRLRFEMLRSSGFFHAAYLMRDAMTTEQYERVMKAFYWYSLFGNVYVTPEDKGETADQIRALMMPKLLYAVAMQDEKQQVSALQSFKAYADNAFSPAQGYLGCLKPDYSGYHHRGPYYSAYYPDALYIGALLYYFLSDTPYALSTETYNHLKNGLLTFRFMCAGYDVPGSTTGRFPTQTQILDKLLPAYAYLALASETPDVELTQAFKNYWYPTTEPLKSLISRVRSDITFKNAPGEVEKMLELSLSPLAAEKNPVGTKFMPYSGLLISRQSDWVLTTKGHSKYIWDFESSSSENLYGRYLSYGHVELSNIKTGFKSYRPGNTAWDWSHIPGTTTKYLTKSELNFQNNNALHRNFSDEPFLGGIAFNQQSSVFANYLHDNTFDVNFYAKKSVFQFDSIYTCLGSGIKNTDKNHFVHTTLFQNEKIQSSDVLYLNGVAINQNQTGITAPFIKDNYGNAYLIREGSVNVEFNTSYITAYINHGKVLNNGRYAYQIVTGISNEDMEVLSVYENNPIEIVRYDELAHVVRHHPSKTLSAVVFNTPEIINAGKLYQVNIPSIIIMQERNDTLEVAFSDPDMHRPSASNISALSYDAVRAAGNRSTIRIELNGEYDKIALDTDVSVIQNGDGKTIIEYTKAKEGETYRVLLKILTTSVTDQDHSSGNKFKLYKRENHTYRVEADSGKIFNYFVSDISGSLMFAKRNIQFTDDICLSDYPEGIYLLNLQSDEKQKCMKLLR